MAKKNSTETQKPSSLDNRKRPRNKIRETRKGQQDRRRIRVTQCQESQKNNVPRSDGAQRHQLAETKYLDLYLMSSEVPMRERSHRKPEPQKARKKEE